MHVFSQKDVLHKSLLKRRKLSVWFIVIKNLGVFQVKFASLPCIVSRCVAVINSKSVWKSALLYLGGWVLLARTPVLLFHRIYFHFNFIWFLINQNVFTYTCVHSKHYSQWFQKGKYCAEIVYSSFLTDSKLQYFHSAWPSKSFFCCFSWDLKFCSLLLAFWLCFFFSMYFQ